MNKRLERIIAGSLRAPRPDRARGISQHPIAGLIQLGEDLAASQPPSVQLPRVGTELQHDLADTAIEHGIVPKLPER